MKNTTDEPMFVLCHGVGDTIHYVEVDPGLTIDTGQPSMDTYLTRDALKAGIDAKFPAQADRDRAKGIINAHDNARNTGYTPL